MSDTVTTPPLVISIGKFSATVGRIKDGYHIVEYEEDGEWIMSLGAKAFDLEMIHHVLSNLFIYDGDYKPAE